MAHPQVTAHAGRALLGTVGAADLLDLLGQGLEGGVDLHVTIAHHVGVVSAVVATTEGIGCLLLNRLADEVESTAGRSWGSSRSGRSGRTLFGGTGRLQNGDTFEVSKYTSILLKQGHSATYGRTHLSIATTRSRGSNGSRQTVHAILTGGTIRSRRSLRSKSHKIT